MKTLNCKNEKAERVLPVGVALYTEDKENVSDGADRKTVAE